jgi:hypothetical protein
MNELESHLLDEIDYIKDHDGLSEEQAFQKAVQLIGQRESLDKEYDKNHGFTYPKFVFWFRNHTLQLFVASLLVIIFLVVDFQFSQSHFNNKISAERFEKKTLNPILSMDRNFDFKIFFSNNPTFKTVQWKMMEENKSEPLFFTCFDLFGSGYLSVLDNHNQLWIEKSEIFTPLSYRKILDTNTDGLSTLPGYETIQNVILKLIDSGKIKDVAKKDLGNVFNQFQEKPPPYSYIYEYLFPFNDQESILETRDLNCDILDIDFNYLDSSFVSLETDKSQWDRFAFFQLSPSKIALCEITYYEEIKEYKDVSLPNNYTLSKFEHRIPNLCIRSYQLERRPLHILPYLYQQISSRLFCQVTPKEQKQVTPK